MKAPYYEVAILHAVLTEGAAAEVFAKLNDSNFGAAYREVFVIANELYERGLNPDFISVMDEAERRGYEGFQDLANDIASSPKPQNVGDYCKELKRLSVSRKLKDLAIQIQHWASSEDPETAYEMACDAVTKIKGSENEDSLRQIDAVMVESLKDIERRFEMGADQFDGLPTGFKDVDERWMGMKPGNLILIPGRPGQGKTTFAMNICEYNAIHGKSVLVFSLEMEAKELADKCLSSTGRIDFGRIMSGKMQEDDWPRLTSAVSLLKGRKLFIDDRHSLTVAEMRAQAYRVKKDHDLDLIMVDYLQLMTSKGHSRENEVANLSRGLKGLAKELGIPVIAVAQLNRKCEERKNKRPINSDLRESGSLEQDANIIAFVYRDDYYYEDSPLKGTAEIITGKGRALKVGTDCLAWQGRFQRFDNLDHRPDVESVIEQQENGGKRSARDF